MAGELRALEVQADTNANLRTSQKAAAKQPEVSSADNIETAAETESTIVDEPTASNKPRISANKANVKRSSASKASANISDFKASKKNANDTKD